MIAAILVWVIMPRPMPYCEMAEINHCHDAAGNLQFVQLLAWDWDYQYCRWNCQQWAIVTDWARTPTGVVADTYSGDVIRLRCKYYRETWTNHDPERANQALFPSSERRHVW